ncbi:putative Glutathione-dependent formaldehyde-activating GFA [Vibrio nigripulchritudo SO65]|uniref:GFA family protein n=1 Tax=Vibrio nigripulchritudo TaxID=28173 RepID=UPI0003B23B79|nr:GFA family protein [Vibrio nigripulchritudo]CCN34195.1 putative Glutathione-dependent formaldehyde-activating GFA [Vibrio nigripulchritudo AM115]CCN44010.1 putative Glutathione-dependent formaldehyde-activating GFA [Vibrio nigripulchritudo FTn2]CCN66912.1 putative Glutathione-dependent formaldehyde-activating GFA [Vibrio nigripulchritudo POn4]CCN76675.1 putative Glutathione-dependent formaldehyde-activating GFA [Vibrio nigripulchritudo SO65]
MEKDDLRVGSCLCGSVQIEIPKSQVDLGVCHCTNCQRWSGGPLFEIEGGTNVRFKGEEYIAEYQSSKWAVRGFCKKCGSHLFIRDENTGEYGIPPGLFEDETGLTLNRQVFVDHKSTYYSFSDDTRNITSEFIYKHFPHVREDKS